MKVTSPAPPRSARWLVSRCLPPDRLDELLGDLEEEFSERCVTMGSTAARRWYWREALAWVPLVVTERSSRLRPRRERRKTGRRFGSGLASVSQDLRFAVRSLWRRPGFTVAAIGCLGLGIGATTAFVSLFDRVLLRPLPVHEPDRLVAVYHGSRVTPYSRFSFADFVDYRDGSDAFDELAARFETEFTVSGSVDPAVVPGELVSANYFAALGVNAQHGRTFAPEEGATAGARAVVVISDAFWRARFHSDSGVVGTSLRINGHPFTVIGVAPSGFRGASLTARAAVWVPLMMYNEVATGFFSTMDAIDYASQRTSDRRLSFLSLVGRLRDGVSLDQARADLDVTVRRLAADYPRHYANRYVTVVPVAHSAVPADSRGSVMLFLSLLIGAVALVLLIACANVANLLLARADTRRREAGIRVALGAGKMRLIRQWLTESVLLAGLAGTVGFGIAVGILELLAPYSLPGGVPLSDLSVELDPVVLAFTFGLSTITGVLFGLAPAVHASRTDVAVALRDGGSTSSRSGALRKSLVASQVALSLVLLTGAGLFLRSLANALAVDLGFDPSRLVTMTVDLGARNYDEIQAANLYREFTGRARTVPGVVSAGVTDTPFGESALSVGGVFVEGREESIDLGDVLFANVGPGYFRTMNIPLYAGRAHDPSGRPGGPWVMVVNDAFARRLWPTETAVGKRFNFGGAEGAFAEVVGVVGDTRHTSLDGDVPFIVYRSVLDEPGALLRWPVSLVVRTTNDAWQVTSSLRDILRAIDPELAITEMTTVDDRVAALLMPQRMGLLLLMGLGGVALIVAGLGVYGAASQALAQRQREIGIRFALGAGPREVTRMMLRTGIGPVVIGVIIGLGGAMATAPLLRSFLFGVAPLDFVTLAVTAVVLIAVALAASWFPARRSARTDPVAVLRDA